MNYSAQHLKNRSKFPAAIIFGFLISLSSASAMIITLPLPDLVRSADLILIAAVSKVTPAHKSNGGISRKLNKLTPEKFLKGKWPTGKSIEIFTFDTHGRWEEDVVTLPDIGERVLLFLEKGEHGELVPVNGIQGVWPLEPGSNKTLGMGFGYSIEDVVTELRYQRAK